MASAIADPDPVLFLMDVSLTGTRGEVPPGAHVVPIGSADVKRPGRDVTVVAMTTAVQAALDAADQLAVEGVEVEIIDPRSLAPLDLAPILESVRRTRHLVIAEQGRRTCGLAAEVSALVVEHAWDSLASPPLRLTWPDIPVPYTPTLERACDRRHRGHRPGGPAGHATE